jgi:hypothetical protein
VRTIRLREGSKRTVGLEGLSTRIKRTRRREPRIQRCRPSDPPPHRTVGRLSITNGAAAGRLGGCSVAAWQAAGWQQPLRATGQCMLWWSLRWSRRHRSSMLRYSSVRDGRRHRRMRYGERCLVGFVKSVMSSYKYHLDDVYAETIVFALSTRSATEARINGVRPCKCLGLTVELGPSALRSFVTACLHGHARYARNGRVRRDCRTSTGGWAMISRL